MNMRYFELIAEQEPVQKVATDAPVDATKELPPTDVEKPVYATQGQQKLVAKQIADLLAADFPLAKVEARTDKVIPHIRIKNALPKQEVLNKLTSSGFALSNKIDSKQLSSSDTYQSSTYSYNKDGMLYTIVLAGKGTDTGAQTGIQTLRPAAFGLSGISKTKRDLVNYVKGRIPSVTKDQIFQQALMQLVDVAAGDRPQVDAELMSHIQGVINLVSQDFGEILTPIAMAKNDSQQISFPKESNKPLIDGYVDGKPVAVKSLGGSGNSFKVIKNLIDSYIDTKRKQDPNFTPSQSFTVLQDFVGDDGRIVDKLIRAAQNAKIPEAVELNKILGVSKPPMNYKELENGVIQLVDKLKASGQTNLYKRYLEIITPAAFAANRMTKPKEGRKSKKEFKPKPIGVGLPADYDKYMGVESEDSAEENKRSAGKKKFEQDFVKAASRQLTYMLGVGFRNHVVEGTAAQEMADTITDVMSAKDAIAAKIEILPDGKITVNSTPFSSLRFGYQYHAGTSTVNQNAPGFTIYFT